MIKFYSFARKELLRWEKDEAAQAARRTVYTV